MFKHLFQPDAVARPIFNLKPIIINHIFYTPRVYFNLLLTYFLINRLSPQSIVTCAHLRFLLSLSISQLAWLPWIVALLDRVISKGVKRVVFAAPLLPQTIQSSRQALRKQYPNRILHKLLLLLPFILLDRKVLRICWPTLILFFFLVRQLEGG